MFCARERRGGRFFLLLFLFVFCFFFFFPLLCADIVISVVFPLLKRKNGGVCLELDTPIIRQPARCCVVT